MSNPSDSISKTQTESCSKKLGHLALKAVAQGLGFDVSGMSPEMQVVYERMNGLPPAPVSRRCCADGIALDSRNTIAETLENLRRTTDSVCGN